MPATPIRIGTRGSALALWQAHHVRDALQASNPGCAVEIVEIQTRGDRILDRPIAAVGSPGVFVREVQDQLLTGAVDLAVHSMKDLETVQAEGLMLAAVPARGPVRDVLVAPGCSALADLPAAARIGTGSPRRRAQLLHLRPDLEIVPIRGNVPTRVDKVRSEGLHAVVLAEAGLVRLGLGAHISFVLSTAEVLPAPGQGALAIECRRGDERVWAALRPLHDEQVAATTQAERTLLRTLRGGCHAPVGAYAQVQGESLRLEACVAAPDGRDLCRATQSGPPTEAEALGRELADQLLAEGVGVWLEESRL